MLLMGCTTKLGLWFLDWFGQDRDDVFLKFKLLLMMERGTLKINISLNMRQMNTS